MTTTPWIDATEAEVRAHAVLSDLPLTTDREILEIALADLDEPTIYDQLVAERA